MLKESKHWKKFYTYNILVFETKQKKSRILNFACMIMIQNSKTLNKIFGGKNSINCTFHQRKMYTVKLGSKL